MSDFTYHLPYTEDKLMTGILYILKNEGKHDIANLLKGAIVELDNLGYSYYNRGGRWNAYAAYVTFCVNPANKDSLNINETKNLLIKICDELIPPNVGYDVKGVTFTIDLMKNFQEDDLILDIEKSTNNISSKISDDILPEDIKIKGQYMAEAYTYLYAVENSLRLFIEKACKDTLVEGYFLQITVAKAISSTIKTRKENAESKKWLNIRANELFYLDFKDLGSLIKSNWNILRNFFRAKILYCQS